MKKIKVAVAMSGGVDSSVAALLLKNGGYDIVGVTLNMLNEEQDHKNIASAQKVCHDLSIPHHIIDVKEEFNRTVIANFCEEYSVGRTPNPCVFCNYTIKFGAFYHYVAHFGVDKMATGHYCNISKDEQSGRYNLIKGKDMGKDQSYFLWRLTQEQLGRTIFPLGDLTKSMIREIAAENGLYSAKLKDSQEVCFVKDNDLEKYLKSHIDFTPGDILTTDGTKVGRHRGYIFYTIGQRKGLGIALGKPVYVVKIDGNKNQIIVGDNSDLLCRELTATQTNFMEIDRLIHAQKVMAKIRYRHNAQPATVEPVGEDRIKVIFDEPQRAITPGQSVVFYRDDSVIGGGIIQ